MCSVLRNGFDVPVGIQARGIKGDLAVKFTGVIQGATVKG